MVLQMKADQTFERVPALELPAIAGATQAAYATIIVKTGRTIAAGQRLHTDRTYWTLHC
jgi:hypothetical protein